MARTGKFPQALRLEDLEVNKSYVLHDLQKRTKRTFTVLELDRRVQMVRYRNQDGEIVRAYFADLGLVSLTTDRDLWHSFRYVTAKKK
jgi:hypothetical protein